MSDCRFCEAHPKKRKEPVRLGPDGTTHRTVWWHGELWSICGMVIITEAANDL